MGPVTIWLADDLEEWLKKEIESGRWPSRTSAVREAVYWMQSNTQNLDITFETVEDPSKPLEDEMAAELAIAWLPTISPGSGGRSIGTAFPVATARAMDVLLQREGVRQKTQSDLIRSLVHVGLRAVDRLMQSDDPEWEASLLMLRMSAAEVARKEHRRFLEEQSEVLYRRLRNAADEEDDVAAVGAYTEFYEIGNRIPDVRGPVNRVLREMPLAADLAWRLRAIMPDESLVPAEQPDVARLTERIGLFRA